MRALPVLLVSTLALAFAAQADAQSAGKKKLYRWTDAEGKVHYTDALPPEAATQARDTLNDAGRAVERTERALTPEERAERDAEAARAAEEKRIADERAKLDAVLVASYPSEAELERAYKERFQLIEQSLESARAGILNQEKSLNELLAHAGNLERNGNPVPATVIESIGKARAQVADQRGYLVKREAERAALQQEYGDVLARYRKLTSDAAQEPGAAPK